jgi:RHS repeat-associated protein
VIQPVFNEANLLERIDVWLERSTEPAEMLEPTAEAASPVGVTNIDYNAKGQRERIDYKNGASTSYRYDPETFRLTQLYTRRGSSFIEDCENSMPPPATIAAPDSPLPGKHCGIQNLHYTYDPVGNISSIRDEAQQTIFFRNAQIEPSNDYVYDAVYRLIQATGREHLGQVGGSPVPHSYNDAPRVGIDWSSNDGNAMGRYCENFVYDEVGNFLKMIHRRSCPGAASWIRSYEYNESSQTENGKLSNRLTSTTIGSATDIYSSNGDGYDPHGNMRRMPQLQSMRWNFRDQLAMTSRQAVNSEDAEGIERQGERTWYVYDSGGQRVRKVTEFGSGQIKDERIYLGGLEIYRRHGVNAVTRETLNVMDDKQRIAMVETRTQGSGPGPVKSIRYQLSNHLDSSSLELDEHAQIVSYEEYTPYGSTAYQAVRSATETPKRYCYTGMERDEESGLNYHSARYYSTCLGRWTRCDPIMLDGGLNLFSYCSGNPILKRDVLGTDEWCGFSDGFFGLVSSECHVVPEVKQAAAVALSTIEVIVGCGLSETGIAIPVCIDGLDNLASAVTQQPTAKQAIISGTLQLGGASKETADYYGLWGSMIASMAVGASQPIPARAPYAVANAEAKQAAKAEARAAEAEATQVTKAEAKQAGKGEAKQVAKAEGSAQKTVRGSSNPRAGEALVGSSRSQMRREAARIIGKDPNHPLRFLLDKALKFKAQKGLKHAELADRPDIVQMGHIASDKLGGQERLMLQGAWENQLNNISVEASHIGGGVLHQIAIDIGGIAVDLKTATFWESIGWLKSGTVNAAPRISL